jgi:signal transduction histidine kinase
LNGELRRLELALNDVFDACRLHHGRLDLQYEQVDLAALLHTVAARFAERDAARHPIVVDASQPVVDWVDRARMEQVLGNLASNAFSYSPQAGEVRFRAVHQPTFAELSITDHGIGIAPEEQAIVFHPFTRSEGARLLHNGAGLGLFIARQLVEHHAGTLQLDSTLGVGSTFTIRLPLRHGPAH